MEITINLMSVFIVFLLYLAVGIVVMLGLNTIILLTQYNHYLKTIKRRLFIRGVITSFVYCWAFPYAIISESLDARRRRIRKRLENSSFINKNSAEEINYRDLCVQYAESVDVWFINDESPTFWAGGKQSKIYKFAKKHYEFKALTDRNIT